MPWERRNGWAVWVDKDGRPTYYGVVAGRRVSTRKDNEADAVAELMRMALRAGGPGHHPLASTLIEQYVAECRARGHTSAGCDQKQSYLDAWASRVGGQQVTLRLLNQISKDMPGRRNRIATLKAYYTWLRQNGHVRRQEDPTLDLHKPEARHRDWDRLVPIESHRAVVARLGRRWADLLTILLGTGWHVTELNRFARGGEVMGDVLLCPKHKSGEPHRTQVSPRVLEAAGRTLEAGGFSVSRLYWEVAEACRAEGIEPFRPGGYRHTVATHAVRNGETPERVAHFLGHKGSYMVKQIYAKAAVPKKIATLE